MTGFVGEAPVRFLHNRTIEMVGTEMHRSIVVSYYGVISAVIDCEGVTDERIWARFTTRFDAFG